MSLFPLEPIMLPCSTALFRYLFSHQGPVSDGDVVLTEAELDALSKNNVERWISAHIIPVSTLLLSSSCTDHSCHIILSQQHPIALTSGEHPTLLDGKPLSIREVSGNTDSPAWTRVVLNENIHIISAKEVRAPLLGLISRYLLFAAIGL